MLQPIRQSRHWSSEKVTLQQKSAIIKQAYEKFSYCFYDFYICCFFSIWFLFSLILLNISPLPWQQQKKTSFLLPFPSPTCPMKYSKHLKYSNYSPYQTAQWNIQNIQNIKIWEKYFRKQYCLACLWSMHWVLLTHCLCWADSLEWSLRFEKKLAIVLLLWN